MADTSAFDTNEKVDILLKASFGFPSADESRAWYEETPVKFNNGINGEDVFLEEIPQQPDFDTNGTIRTAGELNLQESDFANYTATGAKSGCSIVDDATGRVRRFQYLILQETPQLSSPGLSWYKVDSEGNNVITDSFQFNFKQYTSGENVINPYKYSVFTQRSIGLASPALPFGRKGGNWFIDLKSGVLFFSDFNNFSNGTQTDTNFRVNTTDNKPVITIYKYIGKKGVHKILNSPVNIGYKRSPQIANCLLQVEDPTYNSSYSGAGPGGVQIRNSCSTYTYPWIVADRSGVMAYVGVPSATVAKIAGYNYTTGANIDLELGQAAMYVGKNGAISMHSSAPANNGAKLQIHSNPPTQAQIRLFDSAFSGSDTGSDILYDQGVMYMKARNGTTAGSIVLQVSSQGGTYDVLRCHSNGNVGIKKVPGSNYELDVQGDINLSGSLYIGGVEQNLSSGSDENAVKKNANTVLDTGVFTSFAARSGQNEGIRLYKSYQPPPQNVNGMMIMQAPYDVYNRLALTSTNTTGGFTYTFPDKSGTVAMTSDIPTGGGDIQSSSSPTWTGTHRFSNHITVDNYPSFAPFYSELVFEGLSRPSNVYVSNAGDAPRVALRSTLNSYGGYFGIFTGNNPVAPALAIDDHDFVGIGTTSPAYPFTMGEGMQSYMPGSFPIGVADKMLWYGAGFFGGWSGAGGITLGRVTDSRSGSNYYYNYICSTWNSEGSTLLINPLGGNVGIGEQAPRAKFDVYHPKATGNNPASVTIHNEAIIQELKIRQNVDSWDCISMANNYYMTADHQRYNVLMREDGIMYLSSSDFLLIKTGGSERMRILGNGNVGIGTTAPDRLLHLKKIVSGDPTNDIEDMIKMETEYSSDFGGSYREGGCSILWYVENATNQGLPGEAARIVAGCMESSSSTEYHSYLAFHTSNNSSATGTNERMCIDDRGCVGIQSTTPGYPLDVNGYTTWASGGGRDYYDYTVPAPRQWQYTTKSFSLGLDVQYYAWARGYTTSSDERIKKNIRDLSDNESLMKLRDISCVHYEYRDAHAMGDRPTIGFIAQQVASVYPQAVSTVPDFIPNEYRNLTDISWNEVTLTDNSGNTKTRYYLTSESMGDVSGCKYKFMCRDSSENVAEIDLRLIGDENNRFMFKYKYPEIFLYGKEVNDFHILDKPKLYALNFSATQEIDRIQQAEKTKLEAAEAKIANLESEVATLKTQMADVLARLAALEGSG